MILLSSVRESFSHRSPAAACFRPDGTLECGVWLWGWGGNLTSNVKSAPPHRPHGSHTPRRQGPRGARTPRAPHGPRHRGTRGTTSTPRQRRHRPPAPRAAPHPRPRKDGYGVSPTRPPDLNFYAGVFVIGHGTIFIGMETHGGAVTSGVNSFSHFFFSSARKGLFVRLDGVWTPNYASRSVRMVVLGHVRIMSPPTRPPTRAYGRCEQLFTLLGGRFPGNLG